MSKDAAEYLRATYAGEIVRLEQMLDWDLSDWRQ